jgi:hypothetical protein
MASLNTPNPHDDWDGKCTNFPLNLLQSSIWPLVSAPMAIYDLMAVLLPGGPLRVLLLEP